MEDAQIIQLFFARNEQAIQETDRKYGGYCYSIAYNILVNQEDAEECVSDTYYAAWKNIPPRHPTMLSAFLGKISRNLSIDRWRKRSTSKRGGGQIEIALDELQDCISGTESAEDTVIRKEILSLLNRFLGSLNDTELCIFLSRYWYLDSIQMIAEKTGFSASKVKTTLSRLRKRLNTQLEKEGLK